MLAKKLADYYKKKGVVLRLIDQYRGEVEMSDSGDVLQARAVHAVVLRRCTLRWPRGGRV